MDVIPIQASSVACERVFSSGKQTMTPRRGRISALLMEALQILKFSLRKEAPLKFSDMTWKEELKEFERLARSAPPGDAEAYGRNLEEDKGDSDVSSELDEQEINLELLGEQIITGLEDNEDDIY
jgi:hAT family protein